MTRKPRRSPGSLGLAVLVALAVANAGAAVAQNKPVGPAVPKDERALKLLKGMGDTLGRARTLSFRARSLVPMSGPNGQWLSLIALSRVVMERPNKLFVEMRGDVSPNDYYYDGKTWTAIAQKDKFYSQRELPGQTIDAMLEETYAKQDDLFPFADVLWSDVYTRLTKDLTTALYVGQSTVGGAQVDHLAFTAEGLDWEIWIGTRDRLPRLMLGAYRDLERHPMFAVEFMDWKLNAPVATFRAAIPKGATKIEFKRPTVAPATK
jgi:hypothetical protein